MVLEVPCRDTDSIENIVMEPKVEQLSFTIDFGDHDNLEEKTKKFERFAQRSSLRKVLSPRLNKASDKQKVETKDVKKDESKHSESAADRNKPRMLKREKSILARTGWSRRSSKENNVHAEALKDIESLNIQESTLIQENTTEVNDEVASQTGTYDLEEEEELNQVEIL